MKYLLSFIYICIIFLNLNAQSFEERELLVQLKPGTSVREISNQFINIGKSDLTYFKEISKPMNIYHLKYVNNVNLDLIIKESTYINNIIVVQKNHHIEHRVTIPNDSIFGSQWYLNNTGQSGGNIDADIDAPEAWDITTGGNTSHGDTIVVCIIEGSGVDINHIDLAANMWKNFAEIPNNGIDDDNNGYTDDFNGWNVQSNSGNITAGSHGTRVAGMVGAVGNNVTGISGVNHQVKMMIVQGQQASNEASVIAAYSYPLIMRKKYNETNGLEGAFVVATNASWGINNGNPANSPLWCGMYDTLGLHGILNMGATSNSNVNVDVVGDLPTTCPSDFLVSVTSTNSGDFRAGTGYGPIHIDLAAPGSAVLLTNLNNSYTTTSGTSFATPCVSGAVALIYASPCTDFISFAKTYPDSAALKVRDLLLDNVDVLSNLSGEIATSGRLNINNSLLALTTTCDTSACVMPYAISTAFVGDSSIALQWQGLNNSDYIISIELPNGSTQQYSTAGNTSYNFQGLAPCSNYEISLQGLCGTDSSGQTNPILIQTDGCCNNPNLEMDNATETSIDLSWNSILYATNYVVKYQKTGTNAWSYDTINSNSITLLNLDTCSVYEVQIKTICGDSSHQDFSSIYELTTTGCGICYEGSYCEINPNAVNSNSEWIESFTINGITSSTGNNGGFYDGDVFGSGFEPNSNYQISFTPGYSGASFTERYGLWIDLNQNGTFENNEQLISSISGIGPVTGMLFIPATNITGITKMRVAMNGINTPSLCADEGGNIFGEYEDYCVQIGGNVGIQTVNTALPVLFPNPTNHKFTIGNIENIEAVYIYDQTGKTVFYTAAPDTNEFLISTFETGIYTVVMMVEGQIYRSKLVKY